MRSIALFPCSYTDGAGIVGELSAALQLRVYTDEMLFADISRRFGVPVHSLKKTIFGLDSEPCQQSSLKGKYISFARLLLAAPTMVFRQRRLFYGLHTALIGSVRKPVLKILVFDSEERRVGRAMRQEGFKRAVARDYVRRHDEKVSHWTRYLFGKEAYDRSLYDFVITYDNNELLDITGEIAKKYNELEPQTDYRPTGPVPSMSHNYHGTGLMR